jgi:MazG family protein
VTERAAIDTLLEIMARLRSPEGCPWDREQSFDTIAPFTIEEAYEVAEAIAHRDMEALRDELGDLLFQVVFHAQMARETGAFDFAGVVQAVCDKMVNRHPHVFGDADVDGAAAQTRAWEAHKAAERETRAAAEGRVASALDGVALGLPALLRALKLQRRAARVGFDWPAAAPVIDKLREEIDELQAEMGDGSAARDAGRLTDELGDLLFSVVNLARHLDVDAEGALRHGNAKFERRFHRVEELMRERGLTLEQASLAELDALWEEAKRREPVSSAPPGGIADA